VTNLDPSPYEHRRSAPAEPNHPVLQLNGGDSTQQTASLDYWLWPLPPAGVLRVTCEWASQGISETVHDLDAQAFLSAAARARPL